MTPDQHAQAGQTEASVLEPGMNQEQMEAQEPEAE